MSQVPSVPTTLPEVGKAIQYAGWGIGAALAGIGVAFKLVKSADGHPINGNGNGTIAVTVGGLKELVAQLVAVQQATEDQVARNSAAVTEAMTAIARHEKKSNEIMDALALNLGGVAQAVDRIEALLHPKAIEAAVERLLGGRRRRRVRDRRR